MSVKGWVGFMGMGKGGGLKNYKSKKYGIWIQHV